MFLQTPKSSKFADVSKKLQTAGNFFKNFSKRFVMAYICSNFSVYSTFLSKVTVVGAILHPHLKTSPKKPTQTRVKQKLGNEKDIIDLKWTLIDERIGLSVLKTVCSGLTKKNMPEHQLFVLYKIKLECRNKIHQQ